MYNLVDAHFKIPQFFLPAPIALSRNKMYQHNREGGNDMRGRYSTFGIGALCLTFLLGLVLALFLPWAAVILLCVVVCLALKMLIQMLRC